MGKTSCVPSSHLYLSVFSSFVFKSALETNPNSKQFWESYINALLKSNRNKEANTVLNKAKLFLGKGENFTHLEEILGKQDIIYATLNDNKESEEK